MNYKNTQTGHWSKLQWLSVEVERSHKMILDLCNCTPETIGCSSSIAVHEGLEETRDDIWLYVLAHLFYVTHIEWKLKAHKI